MKNIIKKIRDYFEVKKAMKALELRIIMKYNDLLEMETKRAEIDIEVAKQAKALNSLLNINEDELIDFVSLIKTFADEMKSNPSFSDEFYKRIQENTLKLKEKMKV